jgi:hypothetical protein
MWEIKIKKKIGENIFISETLKKKKRKEKNWMQDPPVLVSPFVVPINI